MKKILEASYHLFFFKPYTKYDRWFEICSGILAWIALGIVLYPFINKL